MSEAADALMGLVDTSTDVTPAVEPTTPGSEGIQTDEGFEGYEPLEDTESGENEEQAEGEEDKKPAATATTPKEVRAALKALADSSPENAKLAKQLGDIYGRYGAITKIFPKLSDAENARNTIEGAGGPEGIAMLQEQYAIMEQTDSQIENGDPDGQVLDRVFGDFPQGAVKMLPNFMQRALKADAEGFGNAIHPYLVKGIEGAGVGSAFESLAQKLEANDVAGAKQAVNQLRQWFADQKSKAEKLGGDALNPERQSLKQEWEKLNSTKENEFRAQLRSGITQHVNQELGTRLKGYLENSSLNDAQKRDIAQFALNELGRTQKANKAYQGQISSMMKSKTRDAQRVQNYMKSNVSSVADRVIAATVKAYGLKKVAGKPAPGKKSADGAPGKANASANEPGQPIRVKEKPARQFIDMAKTTEDDLVRGRGWTKGGKYIAWR